MVNRGSTRLQDNALVDTPDTLTVQMEAGLLDKGRIRK